MKRKYIHLMLLPLLVAVVASGCVPAANASTREETGGICILKTDLLGNPLEGAAYQVMKEATVEEQNVSRLEKELLEVDDRYITVLTMPAQVETDDQGIAELSGLPWGTYYLVETKAPEGYERMCEPVRIRIHKYSHITGKDGIRDDNGKLIDNTLHILTLPGSPPETGSREEVIMMTAFVAGIFSLLSLVLLLLRERK